jgi:uncharacterized protein YkwD
MGGCSITALFAMGVVTVLLAIAPGAAGGELTGANNDARSPGCERRLGITTLRVEPRPDQAMQHVAHDTEPRRALSDTGYRTVKSAVVRMADAGARDDAFAGVGAQRVCSHFANSAFRDLVVARRDGQAWIVLAAPFSARAAEAAPAVTRRALELTNQARSDPRRCGGKAFAAVRPLRPAAPLEEAAYSHAQYMATHGYLSHSGKDGSGPAERATRAGYRWHAIGENIAAGAASAEIVVQGWLMSPEHCANLMDPRYTDIGIAYAVNPRSNSGIYWAQLFGAPR